MPDVSRYRPSNRAGSRQRTVMSALLAVGLLASVPSVAPAAGPEASSLDQVLARRRAAQARPDSGQTIATRVTAESRSGVRRLRIGDHQYLSDSDRSYAGYDLGAGSWDTFAAVKPARSPTNSRPRRRGAGWPYGRSTWC